MAGAPKQRWTAMHSMDSEHCSMTVMFSDARTHRPARPKRFALVTELSVSLCACQVLCEVSQSHHVMWGVLWRAQKEDCLLSHVSFAFVQCPMLLDLEFLHHDCLS
eukprot:1831286-Amphidinium_carterae.1